MTETVPTDPRKFKAWADRECGKWPSDLQVAAYWVAEGVLDSGVFIHFYTEWRNR